MNAAQNAKDNLPTTSPNLGTSGFRRQQLEQFSLSSGGVTTAVRKMAVPGDAIETDMVGLLVATSSFQASLVEYRASDSMAGALLDTKG
jgi:hypothetical protein